MIVSRTQQVSNLILYIGDRVSGLGHPVRELHPRTVREAIDTPSDEIADSLVVELAADGVLTMKEVRALEGVVFLNVDLTVEGRRRYEERNKSTGENCRVNVGGKIAVSCDVALSFAGEQRDYALEVARHLKQRGINVFYDEWEENKLWGADLAVELQKTYSENARYVVLFISQEYVDKPWPGLELRAALERRITERRDTILPVRFDNSVVPGLPNTIRYETAEKLTPAELSIKIAEKCGVARFEGKASNAPPPETRMATGKVAFDYSSHNGCYIVGEGAAKFETMWTKASNTSIHVYNDGPSINGVALAQNCTSIAQVTNAKSLDYTSRARTPSVGQIVVYRNKHGFYAAIHVLSIKDDSCGDDRDEICFRYAIQRNGSDDFSQFDNEHL